MDDPAAAQGGRAEPDRTPSPGPDEAADPSAAPFRSRRARRTAEVTGTIPVVPPPDAPGTPVPPSLAAGDQHGSERLPQTAREDLPDKPSKAGRNLPAAIAVGVFLLAVVLGSLLFFPLAFVVVTTAFAVLGAWEVLRSLRLNGIHAPMPPVLVGALAMPAAAYFAGAEGLLFAFVASCTAVLLWRSLDPVPGTVRSVFGGVFVLTWVPFLLGFVFLMLRENRPPTLGLTLDLGSVNPGVVQVVIVLLLVVANDTFGYLVGVLFGKHPMAPKISPKKSWEGFAGSLAGAVLVAVLATVFLLGEHWWVGMALAVGTVLAGTGGDFAESMVKRELGVKDMSNLLPGHGGVMDRLDSILFSVPIAFVTFAVLGRL